MTKILICLFGHVLEEIFATGEQEEMIGASSNDPNTMWKLVLSVE